MDMTKEQLREELRAIMGGIETPNYNLIARATVQLPERYSQMIIRHYFEGETIAVLSHSMNYDSRNISRMVSEAVTALEIELRHIE